MEKNHTVKLSRVVIVLLFVATAALAQSNASKTFDQIRALAGSWEGKTSDGRPVSVDFRDTAGGSAVLSEIHGHGPEDMITMFHMDNDRLMMTHYCGAGNQPRMVAAASPDGKTITFTFFDGTNIAGPTAGHMQTLVLTISDPKHHTEDWTFVQGDQQKQEHFILARK